MFPTQGVELRQNVREGVIMGNRSLVLQRLSTANTGLYSCEAANTVGRGRSNSVNLDIKCKNIRTIYLYLLKYTPYSVSQSNQIFSLT